MGIWLPPPRPFSGVMFNQCLRESQKFRTEQSYPHESLRQRSALSVSTGWSVDWRSAIGRGWYRKGFVGLGCCSTSYC